MRDRDRLQDRVRGILNRPHKSGSWGAAHIGQDHISKVKVRASHMLQADFERLLRASLRAQSRRYLEANINRSLSQVICRERPNRPTIGWTNDRVHNDGELGTGSCVRRHAVDRQAIGTAGQLEIRPIHPIATRLISR